MRYLADKDAAADRIVGLLDQVEYAKYEVRAALHVGRALGLTWTELGQALGQTKQAVSQMAKRYGSVGEMNDAEFHRVATLLGAGDRVVRWEVRVIVSGKVGVSKVTRSTLSTHLRREVAERLCDERGADAELWQLFPDGRRRQERIRSIHHRATVPAGDHDF